MNELSLGSENAFVYGFHESQSIQRFGQLQFEYEDYIKKWMHNS